MPEVFNRLSRAPGHARNGHHEDGDADEDEFEEGGFFHDDEAFVATPDPAARIALSINGLLDAQDAYYESLIRRFKQIQAMLQRTPPLSAIETLTSSHPISLPPESERAKQQWRVLLLNQEPQMVQLGCMDMETILELAKLLKSLLANTVRGRSRERIQNLGAWIWGVLAKCDDIGQLRGEEVSELREIGKRAVGLLVGIRDKSGKAYGCDSEDEGEANEEDQEGEVREDEVEKPRLDTSASGHGTEDLARAKARLREQLAIKENGLPLEPGDVSTNAKVGPDRGGVRVEQQIRMMLDMIITVVGDCYGQRDLLEFRDVWDEGSTGTAEEVEG